MSNQQTDEEDYRALSDRMFALWGPPGWSSVPFYAAPVLFVWLLFWWLS